MEGEKRVAVVVLPAKQRADTHLLDVLFGNDEHIVEFGNEVFFLRLLDEVDDLIGVVERFSACAVRGDFPLNGRNFARDLFGTLQVLPDFGQFLLFFQFFELFGTMIDVERILRFGKHFFEPFEF